MDVFAIIGGIALMFGGLICRFFPEAVYSSDWHAKRTRDKDDFENDLRVFGPIQIVIGVVLFVAGMIAIL